MPISFFVFCLQSDELLITFVFFYTLTPIQFWEGAII